jgi:hypothetical protein
MKGKLGLIVEIAIIVLLAPFALDGLAGARQQTYLQTAPLVVTAAVTTADVTLAKPLFEDDIVRVTTVTSSNATDTPAVTVYTPGTKALTVSGLAANTTRTLYVDYGYARFTGGTDTLFSYLPMFIMLGLAVHVLMSMFRVRIG